jgi:predicted transcriptional regulator
MGFWTRKKVIDIINEKIPQVKAETSVQEAVKQMKKNETAKSLILNYKNTYKMLELANIHTDDLSKRIADLDEDKLGKTEVVDGDTSLNAAFIILNNSSGIVVKGEDEKIKGVATLLDYTRNKYNLNI